MLKPNDVKKDGLTGNDFKVAFWLEQQVNIDLRMSDFKKTLELSALKGTLAKMRIDAAYQTCRHEKKLIRLAWSAVLSFLLVGLLCMQFWPAVLGVLMFAAMLCVAWQEV